MRLVNIGFGNVVSADRVVAIVAPDSAPMKRLRQEAARSGRVIDASQGRRIRAILVTDSGHVVLSAIQTQTITQRMVAGADGDTRG